MTSSAQSRVVQIQRDGVRPRAIDREPENRLRQIEDHLAVTGRRLVRVFFAAAVVAAAAWGAAWLFWGEPSPESQFEFQGFQVVDLQFSPDGQKLAVVSYDGPPPEPARLQITRIIRVDDGRVIHSILNGAWKCAWNFDGSLLAVAAVNGKDFDILGTAKWDRKRHLTLAPQPAGGNEDSAPSHAGDPSRGAEIKDWIPSIVQRLCFDRQGNLFAVMFDSEADSSLRINHAKVWWDPVGSSAAAESIGSCGGAWDVAAVASGSDALVALSYNNSCSPEILRIGPRSGKMDVVGKVELKGLPHELTAPRMRLTPDGNYLAARDQEHFDLITLSPSGPRLVFSTAAKTAGVKGALLLWKEVEISRDGHFAAYATDDHLKVVHIPDGKSVLEILHPPCAFALAPDASLLAVADQAQHAILVYRIP